MGKRESETTKWVKALYVDNETLYFERNYDSHCAFLAVHLYDINKNRLGIRAPLKGVFGCHAMESCYHGSLRLTCTLPVKFRSAQIYSALWSRMLGNTKYPGGK